MDVFDRTVVEMNVAVAHAASAYEVRWSPLALRRADPIIAKKLEQQRQLYTEAVQGRSPSDVREQGEALVRGYRKAVEVVQEAHEPEDNYLLGKCPRTGWRIVIGHNPAQAQLGGEAEGCAWFTPDEIAALFAETEGAKALMAAKRAWPGATVTSVTPTRPGDA